MANKTTTTTMILTEDMNNKLGFIFKTNAVIKELEEQVKATKVDVQAWMESSKIDGTIHHELGSVIPQSKGSVTIDIPALAASIRTGEVDLEAVLAAANFSETKTRAALGEKWFNKCCEVTRTHSITFRLGAAAKAAMNGITSLKKLLAEVA